MGSQFLCGFFVVFFYLSICHGIVFAAILSDQGAKLAKKIHYKDFLSIFAALIRDWTLN